MKKAIRNGPESSCFSFEELKTISVPEDQRDPFL